MGRGRRPPPGAAEYEVGGRYGTPQLVTEGSSSVRSVAVRGSCAFRPRNPAPTTATHKKYGIRPRMWVEIPDATRRLPGDTAHVRQEVGDPALGQREETL